MIQQAIALLNQAGLELTAEEVADILWLAIQMGEAQAASPSKTIQQTPASDVSLASEPSIKEEFSASTSPISPHPSHLISPQASLYPSTPPPPPPSLSTSKRSTTSPSSSTSSQLIPFETPAAPALRNPLALARALRPLMRKVASRTETILDEEATARQIAEKNIWIPVLEPAPERWLELALVIEETSSLPIWQETIAEFQKLLERHGAFRDVHTWRLCSEADGTLNLLPGQGSATLKQRPRSPKELLDPAGRRLIILVSDCASRVWRLGKIQSLLRLWANQGSVAVLQLLPERFWMRSAMGAAFPVQLGAFAPGVSNTKLVIEGLPPWQEVNLATALTLPVVTLEPEPLAQWARVVAGTGGTRTAGVLFDPALVEAQAQEIEQTASPVSASELVKRFRATASPTARRLAGLMAATPVSLPVVRLIQQTMLPESGQIHVAEVFMSGLLRPVIPDNAALKSDPICYDFQEGVRELLLDSVPISDTDEVLEQVSQFIARKAGLSIKSFRAFLSANSKWDETVQQQIAPFAQVTTQVLRRLGGEYAALAEQLERSTQVDHKPSDVLQLPPLSTFEFDVATITLEAETETAPEINLQPFKFEVATIELKQTGEFTRKTELIIKRRQQQARSFIEDLGNGVELEMVAIPEGSFVMGSPKDEPERSNSESPQHTVMLKSFFLGKYPVTQAQWKAVAALPQVNRELDPDPSEFKGENRPVERVSWYEAVEFCDRLSQKTGRQYRLPSEAEWEYACRAGTTTPFHFCETITPELANYNGNYTYGAGVKGVERGETTQVGSFGVANAFGLYDMHGNVWEWCADPWHENYKGAPTDGSAWLDENDNDNQVYVLRGGSWYAYPGYCRSACRLNYDADVWGISFGFRVVCAAARTQ
jgi:formylglycine-generating enzyme required for sulfatase activity